MPADREFYDTLFDLIARRDSLVAELTRIELLQRVCYRTTVQDDLGVRVISFRHGTREWRHPTPAILRAVGIDLDAQATDLIRRITALDRRAPGRTGRRVVARRLPGASHRARARSMSAR